MKSSFVWISIFLATLMACGGGGGGGGVTIPTPAATPIPTATPFTAPDEFFVRATQGNDANDGTTPETAFRTIGAAIAVLTDGDTIIVGPGTYRETIILTPPGGTELTPIVFRADPSGSMTSDPPGRVILDGGRTGSTVRLTNFPYATFDSFEITGASGNNGGVQIRSGSHHVTVQNCRIRNNEDDDPATFVSGVLIQDSDDVLIFNNLIHDNEGRGISIVGSGTGSSRARVINNTVVRNNRGISIGTGNTASPDAFLLNNILQDNVDGQNRDRNIVVSEGPPSSVDGYTAQHNLVFPLPYNPTGLPHPTDINEDALFVDAAEGNFLLSQLADGQGAVSPAVDAGSVADVPGSAVDFSSLLAKTTATNGRTDTAPIDLGFHDVATGGGFTFYVRAAAGSDSNNGMTSGQAFKTISAALDRASAGDIIVVGPGNYDEAIVVDPPSGEAGQLLTFLGDPTGRLTADSDAPGAVVVDAGGNGRAAFSLPAAQFVVLDGFTVTGGNHAGIEVRSNSSNVVIRNCQSLGNPGEGILVRDSSGVLVFNNLVAKNDGSGIIIGGNISGSEEVQVVNNTVADNMDQGIRIGELSTASSNVLLQNNLVQNNESAGIQTNEQSVEGVQVSYNLVFPENYIPQDVQGANDINEDAELVGGDDYHLIQATSPAVDAGDPATDAMLEDALGARTTDPDGAHDTVRVDLGYHYLIP